MLFRMTMTMENMDAMEQHMSTISTRMTALPAIVAELNQINTKMGVITQKMDSNPGQAGRMMPWMPFGPRAEVCQWPSYPFGDTEFISIF